MPIDDIEVLYSDTVLIHLLLPSFFLHQLMSSFLVMLILIIVVTHVQTKKPKGLGALAKNHVFALRSRAPSYVYSKQQKYILLQAAKSKFPEGD